MCVNGLFAGRESGEDSDYLSLEAQFLDTHNAHRSVEGASNMIKLVSLSFKRLKDVCIEK